MKFLNLASLFFSSVVILACSGGDESNPVSNNSRENFVGVKYPLVLDEANQKFSTYEVSRHDVCKVDDDKYEFVTMVDTQHIERDYDFRGDTLVIFYSDGDVRKYGQIFVGGKNGQIKNKWKKINCEYIQESNSLDCSGKKNLSNWQKNTITYFEFTQDTIFASVTDLSGKVIDMYAPTENEYDDYTRSYYMEMIFNIIVKTNENVGLAGFDAPWTVFDEYGSFEWYVQNNNVVINSRDKKHISFVIDGQNFEVEFTKAKDLQYNRGSYTEVGATLKSDNGVCVLDYMSDPKMTPEICKAENAKLMDFATTYNSKDSLLYYGADSYHIGNAGEFRDCIVNLVKSKNAKF